MPSTELDPLRTKKLMVPVLPKLTVSVLMLTKALLVSNNCKTLQVKIRPRGKRFSKAEGTYRFQGKKYSETT